MVKTIVDFERSRVERQLLVLGVICLSTSAAALVFMVAMYAYAGVPVITLLQRPLFAISCLAMALVGIALLIKRHLIKRSGDGWKSL